MTMANSIPIPLTMVVLIAGVVLGQEEQQPSDGLRTVNVQRFGIVVKAPVAWPLIRWAQDNTAFTLRLPQEDGSRAGYVSCELAVAPESLTDYQRRHQEADQREQKQPMPRRKLVSNAIEKLDAKRFGKQAKRLTERLLSLWEYTGEMGEKSYELCSRVISEDTLYTITLVSDEAHFAAYRLDFEELVAGAQYSPPETGLRRMPGGFWMQRQYLFALRLPPEWKPAFGPSDKALFFATGTTREVFTDNLIVLAEPGRPIDFDVLLKELPDGIAKIDPAAKVTCQLVPQNGQKALETVIETKRGPFEITILERRFRGEKRNYEVKFTCESSEFKKIEVELRKVLDSFREVAESKPESVT